MVGFSWGFNFASASAFRIYFDFAGEVYFLFALNADFGFV